MSSNTNIEELREEIMQRFVTAWQDGFGCATNKNYESRHDLHTDFVIQLIQQKVIEARIKQIDNLWEAVPIDTEHVGTVKDISNLQKIKLKSQLNHNKKGYSDEKNQI